MKWNLEAEDALKKVPFFVRKKVKAKIEKEAEALNKEMITLTEVHLTRKRFLSDMGSDIKGYQLDACFGSGGCPNRVINSDRLMKRLESLFSKEDLLGFLKKNVKGDLKFHHEFRVTVADCPNACSQPQIKDIGIIGAAVPEISAEECTLCGACVATCREDAVSFSSEKEIPEIDYNLCLHCGKCSDVCPAGTIDKGREGFRVLLGGKLGRHPRLAVELQGLFDEDEVIDIVRECIGFYKANSRNGKRFAELIDNEAVLQIQDRCLRRPCRGLNF